MNKYIYRETIQLPQLVEIQLQLDENRLSPLRDLLVRIGAVPS